MFEIKHLRTLETLNRLGSLRKTSEALFTSQSALSHQIKDLELRINKPLFIRNTTPVQFTSHGLLILNLAKQVLPKIEQTITALSASENQQSTLNIAIACHACFQWLFPIIADFSQQYPTISLNFLEQHFDDEHYLATDNSIDILFTDEKTQDELYQYAAIGEFEVLTVFAHEHPFSDKRFITATDFSQQTLLTYPIKKESLDLFKLFLSKESYQPIFKTIKQVANSHVILQMVVANMGIAVLPDWLICSLNTQSMLQTKRIGKTGIFKTLYVRYPKNTEHKQVIERLIPPIITAFNRLYKTSSLDQD